MAAVAGAGRRVGLEADNVTWSNQRSWDELFDGTEVVPTRGVVERLRVVKDAGEVARMERAAAIADEALGSVLPLLAAVGSGRDRDLSEASFAAALDNAMRQRGAEEPRVRDHRGVRGELGQAPRPSRRPAHPPR